MIEKTIPIIKKLKILPTQGRMNPVIKNINYKQECLFLANSKNDKDLAVYS